MTTRLQIRLDRDEADALARLAASELRDPRDQIRLVVRRELERRGLLSINHNVPKQHAEPPEPRHA